MENKTKYFNPEYDFVQSLNLEREKEYFLKVNYEQLKKIVEHFSTTDYESEEIDYSLDFNTSWQDFVHIVNKYKGFKATHSNKNTWLENLRTTYFLFRGIPDSKRNQATLYFQLKLPNINSLDLDKNYGILDTSIEYQDKALIIEYSHISRFRNLKTFINQKQEQLQYYIDNYQSDNYNINKISGAIWIDNLDLQKIDTLTKMKELFNLS